MALPDSVITVAEILKGAGYTTGVFGKWSLGLLVDGQPDEGYPTRQGFDVFFGYDNQTMAHRHYPMDLKSNDSVVPLPANDGIRTSVFAPDTIQERLIQFIEQNRKKPFFLYYALTIPHAELIVPDDSLLRKFKGTFPEEPFRGNDYGADDFKWTKYCSQEYPNATYAAMVARLDLYVGRIIEKLEEEGILDNTIVFFTSDNGAASAGGRDPDFFNSAGNLRGRKGSLFEGGIRTPFLAFWEGNIAPGSQSDHISAFQDVLPTLAEIAGTEIPEHIDGISFLPVLTGKPQQKKHDYLYWEHIGSVLTQAVRKDDWKAVGFNILEDHGSPLMLFDLENDPCETTDISGEFPDVVREMKQLMKDARTESAYYLLYPLN
jgi:arylsulfatase A-like enzyme